MEQIGVFPNEEWNSLSNFFTFEEGHLNNWDFETSANSWPIFERKNIDECQFNSFDAFISEFHCLSQESGNDSSGFSSDFQSSESNKLIDPFVFSISESKRNSSLGTYFLDDDIGGIFSANEDILLDVLGNEKGQLKRKLTMPSLMNCSQYMSNIESFSMTSKKKPRVSENTLSKKNTKFTLNSNVKEMENAASDDFNASGELSIGSVSKEGKKRKANGGATDSQSVYARKRREKINERLKTLQKLVPNGTKVDISTMLDEAVHYVKFLQLQIKLLSSNDKWMYSPIAYNGMDSGLHSL